jgi:hypothetical protein
MKAEITTKGAGNHCNYKELRHTACYIVAKTGFFKNSQYSNKGYQNLKTATISSIPVNGEALMSSLAIFINTNNLRFRQKINRLLTGKRFSTRFVRSVHGAWINRTQYESFK